MKKNIRLDIRGTLLDKSQLENYFKEISSDHIVRGYSNVNTNPIYRLRDDYSFILATYNLLVKHLKLGIKIHSAGEWVLDNFYIIEQIEKSLEKDLLNKKYKELVALSNKDFEGFPRIYVLAEELVAYSDCKIDKDLIDLALKSYNTKKYLSMNEISVMGTFIKVSIIARIRMLCEKIYSSQVEKYKVENILERIIENNYNGKFGKINQKYLKYKMNDETYKYSFIEYMSYKLKKYGKDAFLFQEILNKEVSKLGLSVNDVIQKEHLYIANLKITMGNCITTLKEINRLDFTELFSYMNTAEEILNQDPANIFYKLDEDSKKYIRENLYKKSRKTKISEIYIAEKMLELARKNQDDDKRKHIAYYLLTEDGIKLLDKELEITHRNKMTLNQKSRLYIGINIFGTLLITFYLFVYMLYLNIPRVFAFSISIINYLLILEIVIRINNYLLNIFSKRSYIIKMNYEDKIPDDAKTVVVIPTIINSIDKVKEMFKKLEIYYLANKLDNLYFVLLGDASEEMTQEVDYDLSVITSGKEICDALNKKYISSDGKSKFSFIYRKRVWSQSEKKYIGWERKRGLLYEFNKSIKGRKDNTFWINTILEKEEDFSDVKYVITLDSDTELILNSAPKLIGAMDYILNRPIVVDKKVISGYGIMQPRIGLDLSIAQKTKFIELYGIKGGLDFYANAVSDVYQDCFKEGIFTGKGIYDVDVYNKVLEDEIPENMVLSHDLLEGNYLRCALVSDIVLLDGYPVNYLSYVFRNHRWIRGDWQICKWLFNNKLNEISKFKIFDNLRRSITPIIALLAIIIGTKYGLFYSVLSIITLNISYIIDLFNYIIFKESNYKTNIYGYKKFSNEIDNVKINIFKIIIEISNLPYTAYKSLDAIIRSIYRMNTKTKLLEWVTSEDGDKKFKASLKSYYKEMIINLLLAVVIVLLNKLYFLLAMLWVIAPFIMYLFSLENISEFTLTNQERDYLLKIGNRTWKYFEKYIKEEYNYLIPDNYQEDRINKIVYRTSSTNIGLELLSIISASDLGYISTKKALEYLKNVLNTVAILSRWNGHLYNWYDIKTCLPLKPLYISTVDSGNFVGYLYIVRKYLEENKNKGDYDYLIDIVNSLINEADFSKLYSYDNKLFSIGFNLEENKLSDSYYDFLASEARQASFIAIAKKDIPIKHWNNLSRTLTVLNGYKGLVSWTGTAFEYLMPNISMKKYKGSLLDESCKFAVMSQIEYAKRLQIPWGISESAFNLRDLNNNYQYRAFGIPWLGLKRGLEEDIVISPYSTFLSLEEMPKEAIRNIKKLASIDALSDYGFYDAIDYTPSRIGNNKEVIVRNYMAHHQGLILLSINNFLNKNILKKRFNNNLEIEAVNVLLEERMPIQTIITKQRKERITKNKLLGYNSYKERVYLEKSKVRNVNVLSNDKYQIIMDDRKNEISLYDGKMINNFKNTKDIKQGKNVYIKSLNNKFTICLDNVDKVIFAPDRTEYIRQENNLKIKECIFLDPNSPTEIRKIEIENLSNKDEILEIVTDFEPSLSYKMQEYSHPAFNKMFGRFYEINDDIVFEKINRETEDSLYLATCLYTEEDQIGDFDYEIDKEKYLGREFYGINNSNYTHNFSNKISLTIDPIIAMKRTIKIKAKEKGIISQIITVGENRDDLITNLEELKSNEELGRLLNIAKIRSEEEGKYLQVSGKKIEQYMELLKYIINPNKLKKYNGLESASKDSLWKYSISGDNPIILIKVKNIEDIYVLEEIIEAYEYYKVKNIKVDLVIVNHEIDLYERYVRTLINEVISNKQLNYLIDVDGGIHILNSFDLNKEDYNVLDYISRIEIDYNSGSLEYIIREMQNKEKQLSKEQELIKDIVKNNDEEEIALEKPKLVFDNSFGGFIEGKNEYYIYKSIDNRLPSVWGNVLSNKFFGTVVTDNLGGYTWEKNSRLNRLTSWNNDRVQDLPSEIYYIKDMDNKEYWTLNSGVVPNKNYYYITHGFGYSKFENTFDDIKQELTIFIPNNKSVKVMNLHLTNLSQESKNLKLLSYIKPVLGEDEYLTNGNLLFNKVDLRS